MPKFRKKPVVVEATQWFKHRDNLRVRRFRWEPDDTHCKHCDNDLDTHGWIDTLEGGHIVCPGDWVITGVRGEHYSCKPDIFDATYEAAE